MTLTDLLTPALYRKWHALEKECPGLFKQRYDRLKPIFDEFAACIRSHGLLPLSAEVEISYTKHIIMAIDEMIELATKEPKHGSN